METSAGMQGANASVISGIDQKLKAERAVWLPTVMDGEGGIAL